MPPHHGSGPQNLVAAIRQSPWPRPGSAHLLWRHTRVACIISSASRHFCFVCFCNDRFSFTRASYSSIRRPMLLPCIRLGGLVTATSYVAAAPYPFSSCKLAKRKIRFANQHSPLERTFFLTSSSASRLGDRISALLHLLSCAFLHRRCRRRDLSGIVRRMVMGAFVVPYRGRLDAHRSRGDARMSCSGA